MIETPACLPPLATSGHSCVALGSLLIDCLLLTASNLSRISWASKWGDKPMSPCATLGACAADQLQCHYYQPLHILLYWQISSRSNNTLSSHLFTLYTGQQSQDRRLLEESVESATSHLSIWGSGKPHLQNPAWYICSIRNSHKIIG